MNSQRSGAELAQPGVSPAKHWNRTWPVPERLLDVRLDGPRVVPRYLTGPADHALAAEALAALRALRGQPRAEVEAALFARAAELGHRRLAWLALTNLVRSLCGFRSRSPVQPALLREAVFAAAAVDRAGALDEVSNRFGMSPDEVRECLYADVPAERLLGPVPEELTASSLAACYNLSLAQGVLVRAEAVTVRVSGNWATVLRHASRQQLLCRAKRDAEGVAIRLSGPLSLFHHTTKYGRAMAGWLPVVIRAPGWRLEATCRLRRAGRRVFCADHRDPVSAVGTRPLKPFDSDLERRFARDLTRLAGDRFEVLREADPVQLEDGRVVCPDFTLVGRPDGAPRLQVELVGFWTPQYLSRKLALLRALPSWIVCIDESLAAGHPDELPAGPLFRFRRRIVVEEFLAFVDSLLG
jgi:predicted nuclease of restriction endonuclease-like RecB superfamily